MVNSTNNIGTDFINAFQKLDKKENRELVVFGAGAMAGCLVSAFVEKDCFKKENIVLVTKSEESASRWSKNGFSRSYSINAYLNEGVQKSDVTRIVLIGVKPQYRHEFYSLLGKNGYNFNANIVCSILAGVTYEMLKKELSAHKLHSGPIIRLTPNVPCGVGSGLTLLYGTDEKSNELVTKLLKAAGDVMFVNESSFNAASAIAGSGPAFAFLMIEGLSDGGVLAGLPRENATQMAAMMLRGAADLLLKTGKHSGQLKDQVCSPGGTTIRGIQQLEKHGVRSALIEAVVATKERADQLGS